jgi:hypothetical protein
MSICAILHCITGDYQFRRQLIAAAIQTQLGGDDIVSDSRVCCAGRFMVWCCFAGLDLKAAGCCLSNAMMPG